MPIKFIGTGEHLDALEEFHPDRMAGRILGMGDVLTLVEQAQREDRPGCSWPSKRRGFARASSRSTTSARCSGKLARWGRSAKLLGMIPGMGGMSEMLGDTDVEGEMNRLFGIIDSMTADERRNPSRSDRSQPPPPNRRRGGRRAA